MSGGFGGIGTSRDHLCPISERENDVWTRV